MQLRRSFAQSIVVVVLASGLVFGVVSIAGALETFDTAPPLGSSQAPGVWYPDRYPPAAFDSVSFGGDSRLHIGISSADADGSRPSNYSGTFYNTQGRKFDLPEGATVISGDLYIGPDWETNDRRSDLWITNVDAANNVTGFPILGFVNGTGFRVFDTDEGWKTIGFPAGFTYGRWYTLKVELVGGQLLHYVDGQLVYTDSGAAPAATAAFDNVMLQAYNFGGSYDVYWDNVGPLVDEPEPPQPPVVSTPADAGWSLALLAMAGVGLAIVRRFRFA